MSVNLDRRSFAYFDVERGDWAVTPGDFEILVGPSSGDIAMRQKLTFTK
jgi:beta-glucosidase